MTDLLCPFGTPLIKQDFGCEHAKEIIRRGGTEIACQQSDMHKLCRTLHETVKAAALQDMDMEDDLLTLPHNVLVKIQYGGLLGLQTLVTNGSQPHNNISNIASLVSSAITEFNGVGEIPLDTISKTIIDYKVQRRGKSKKGSN